MTLALTAEERVGVQFLCAGKPAMLETIKTVLARQPGSTALQARARASLSALQATLPYESTLLPLAVARAAGAHITDVDGHDYIDCHSTYTATILGHNPPPVLHAVAQALERGLAGGHFFEEQVQLGELVRDMVPDVE